ncbi:MAG: ATP synthase F0 subunit C [Candidatus Cloacimonetes bacterium]|nr:ATP synthase F0 subunit C [Candidatus Cloacimonadota bacterium]
MEITREIIQIAAYLGAGISVSIASVTSGIGVGYIAGEASFAMMRQPRAGDQLFRNMFISQAVTETGGIFSLVISLLLLFGGFDVVEGGWYRFAAMLAAGFAIGFGSIGPVLGSGYTGGQACKAIGRMPKFSNAILGNMLIGQALAQTSSIFALVIALLLLYSTPLQPASASWGQVILKTLSLLAAGISIGLGTMGPGTGIGYVAGRASEMIGRHPAERPNIMRTMFLGAAVSESTAIYSLVISFLLLFAIH